MSLIISAVFDGPLTGGLPKGVEITVLEDVADLSAFGLGSANNGGGTDGEEFTFPAVAASAGDRIYVASEAVGFEAFLGFAPDYVSGAMSINGDDAIELFRDGAAIDTFGDVALDGTGQPWDYLDGWAARVPGSTAGDFDLAQWSFSGPDALDGAATNATASDPIPLGSFTAEPPARSIVINEIDSDTPGADSAEFIELYDGGAGNTALDGLTVVLFNGNGDAAYRTVALDGFSTDAEGYFVIGSAGVANLDLDVGVTGWLQNGADAVALYEGAAPATGEAATTVNLVDAVAYDTNDSDDAGLLAALGLGAQLNEAGGGDKDNQSLARLPDGTGGFTTQAPTPGATNVIEPPVEITLVSEIQGAVGTGDGAVIGVDDVSPLLGETVTVRAIVTADFQDKAFGSQGDRNGFYIQEEVVDYDLSDLTSEGIFVFDGSFPDVDVLPGDLVEVTGTVSEFFGQTQISAQAVAVLETGQMIPDAVELALPAAGVAIAGGEYVANLEAYEGMRVSVPELTVTELFNLDRFAEYGAVAGDRPYQFTQLNEPDATAYDAYLREVAARSVFLDDGQSSQNPDPIKVVDGDDGVLTASDTFSMGDRLTDVTGVLNYSFGQYRIDAPTGGYEDANPRPETPEEIGGTFTVASLNVLNFFTTIDLPGATTDNGSDPRGANSALEFQRQAEKLVAAVAAMGADVLGLIELENDFLDADVAIEALVTRVNAALGAEIYAWVDPGREFVGGDAISNGLIYRQDEVGLLGDAAILETFRGRDFLDPLDAGRDLNRPAVAQTFEDLDTGETITISVNHLKSKGSPSGLAADEDQGDGQGRNNATRTEAADILGDWMLSDPTKQKSDNLLILGDLNAYAREDPLDALRADGFTDIAAALLGGTAYGYVFDGFVGTLDYALANDALLGKVAGVTEWHINADEADAFDYNLDFGRNPDLFDGSTPARNSDHDPVLVSFDFGAEFDVVAGTGDADVLLGGAGPETFEGLGGDDVVLARGGSDLVLGGDGRDRLLGGNGDDTIDGGAGNDVILGGRGDDLIEAGGGSRDLLAGGAGADTFLFSAAIAADGARDGAAILGFDASEDVIDLDGTAIAGVERARGGLSIELEGGDSILLLGLGNAAEATFAGDLPLV